MLTKAQKKWIKDTSALLDVVDAMDPNDPALAPFKTRNWIRKGWILGRTWGPGQDSPTRRAGGE